MLDDFKLIDLVQQNDHLYNKNHGEYRDMMKKTITWKAIGAALGTTGEICRKRFRCLRDRFNKERKVRQEEMLTDPSLPAVYKKMLFLWDHLTHRRLVPVATRLLLVPLDDSADPPGVTEEIEKQILILKEDEKATEMQNASNEEMDDSSEDVIIDDPEKTSDEINATEEQAASVSSDIVSEDICSTSKKESQILSIEETINNNVYKILANATKSLSKDNQKVMNENVKECNINNLHKSSGNIFERENDLQFKKIINPKLATKRTFLKSALQRTSPTPKRKASSKYMESLPKNIDLVNRDITPILRPSSNEAFCIIVKSYLDKITNPERLSSARLQILTTLHNELYSTCT